MDRRFSPRVGDLVRLLEKAARAGAPCPSNEVLAIRLGVKSTRASALLRKAQEQGLIVVDRGHTDRVVSAPDGSWRTAGVITKRHYTQADPPSSPPPATHTETPST